MLKKNKIEHECAKHWTTVEVSLKKIKIRSAGLPIITFMSFFKNNLLKPSFITKLGIKGSRLLL